MAFKRAEHLSDVVPISDWQAKHAMESTASVPGGMREKHDEAMERAKGVQDDSIPEAMGVKETPADYKIQVFFGAGRTVQGPNAVEITFWESGKEMHGGGDASMLVCRDTISKKKPPPGCGLPFSSDHVLRTLDGLIAVCPNCKRALNAERLGKDFHGRVESRTLARFLVGFWRHFNGNADLYLKFQPGDIRYVAASGDGAKGFRRGQIPSIYSLKRILEDTNAGSALEDRFYAFLTA
jgi:hypothetical protein